MDAVLARAERYAALGVCLQFLCGRTCAAASHGRDGHPPEMSGKIPLRGGWNKLGYRTFEELKGEYQAGCNLSVLTGWQGEAVRLSLVVVDCDSELALRWARATLPPTPWRVKTRRGEHWYYRCAGPVRSRDLRKFQWEGGELEVQVQADGKQVVAAGSTHRCGHVYEEDGGPWTAENAAELPTFDPAWLPRDERRPEWGSPSQAWPTPRAFSARDYDEAADRASRYLTSPNCPASVAKSGGDQTLYDVAVKLLRGWPLCSEARREELRAAKKVAPVNARDALGEALRMLEELWNPRCLDADGETPYPWPVDRLVYKLEQAAQADRLPGPDYWLFDDAERRRRWAEENPADPKDQSSDGEGKNGARFAGIEEAQAVPDEPAREEDERGGPLRIEGKVDIAKMMVEAERALAAVPDVYVKDGKICHLVREMATDAYGYARRPRLRDMRHNYMVGLLSKDEVARWTSEDGDEEKVVRPDLQVVRMLHDAGSWPTVRPLNGIVYTPTLRQDGSVLQRPGYDRRTGLLYLNDELPMKEVKTAPTRKACEDALDFLLDVVRDFPFTQPELHRAVWLSAVLTRFCRFAFQGNVPMFVVSSNDKSGGKGKVVNSACIICDGREVATTPFTGKNDDELARSVLSYLRDGVSSVCLDNIARGVPLSSSVLELLLTNPSYAGRVVRTSEIFRAQNPDTIWWATGCEVETAGDMSRRVLRMDILDLSGKSADRPVKHPDLEGYCKRSRGKLVRAALTLLTGWYAAGKPTYPLVKMASFEAWSGIVRNCVVWCGLPDPGLALGKAGDDAVAGSRAILFRHLLAAGPFCAGELLARLDENARKAEGRDAALSELRNFLADEDVKLKGDGAAASLGRYLKTRTGPVETIDGKRYRLRSKRGASGVRHWIEEVRE